MAAGATESMSSRSPRSTLACVQGVELVEGLYRVDAGIASELLNDDCGSLRGRNS